MKIFNFLFRNNRENLTFTKGQKVMVSACELSLATIHSAKIIRWKYKKKCSWGIIQDWYKVKRDTGQILILPEKFIKDYESERIKIADFLAINSHRLGEKGFSFESYDKLMQSIRSN